MNLYEEINFKPLLSERKLVSGYGKLKYIEQEMHKALKDNENFVGVDFCDVGTGFSCVLTRDVQHLGNQSVLFRTAVDNQ